MTPVSTPSSTCNSSLVPRVFITRNVNCSSRSYTFKKLSAQKLVLPLSTSLRLFPSIRTCILPRNPRTQIISSAAGTEIAVEETDSPVVDKDAGEPVSTPAVQPRRSGQGRRSEMPPVKKEDLVAGASFTGKVRSIQPFGAFIDFGAFTDGLVHVSQLSNSFVKDVNSVVSIGQEVTVRLVDVNFETGRISLSMKDEDDTSRSTEDDSDRPQRTPRKTGQKFGGQRREKQSKFVKGQMLTGTVKNITRSGAFLTLPEGEEGFLPSSEEADSGLGSMMMGSGSSLEVGQEVNVWVLKLGRGVTLTMKKESEGGDSDDLTTQGMIYTATNPFLLAFRQNQEIATFLDEREKELEPASNDAVAPIAAVDQKTEEAESTVEIKSEGVKIEETPSVENVAAVDVITEESDSTAELESEAVQVEETPSVETVAAIDQKTEEADSTVEIESQEAETEVPTVENVAEVDEKTQEAESTVEIETEVKSEIPSLAPEDSNITSSSEESTVEEIQINEVVENQIEVKEEVPSETPQVVENGNVVPVSEQLPEEKPAKATISPQLVKQLREETGAGMMDCKNALSASDGDIVKAQEFLRKKGLASADKKSSRVTAEGRIGSYIHDSRIGVLIEVNCETDFVSRGDIFKGLVEDLAMQVAACPQVQYLTTDDVAVDFVEKEKAIEMQKEDLLSKPEQIREKIVEGRIRKRVEELALLEQPYIKNDKVTIKDWVKQNIATIGENIKVKRFVRFNLGEGLEKKSQDFAAEVAAQTTAKAPVVKEAAPVAPVVEEVVEKGPKIAISAALVKQLREETGAGMMDCKKALAETSGDLEKAQEYLRKKGLSAADKKSSRLAAEGRVGSYIHDARIGVLIEVNCETDFVGRSEKFKELVDDLAMQVAACPSVQFVSIDDIPESVRSKEKSMELEREDILSKPENMRERIAEGRVSKRLGEMALLEQKYIKDDSVLVKDLVKSTIAALGENIKVRRFARFTLGEDI